MKNYTIGQVARILGFSEQTVRRRIDKGKLKGFKNPSSQWRTVAHGSLANYVKRWGIVGNKKIYTVGQVARILGCSQHAVTNAFRRKELMGFRLPGSTHRRIFESSLIKYMKEHGIAISRLKKSDRENA